MILNYRRFGNEGPSLIILHGLLGLSDNWVSIAKIFSKRYRVYIPDLRNHGNSFHSDEFGYTSMSCDIDQLINANEIENPIIMGHSMGGKLAMIYALNNPEMIRKLIIVDISPVLYAANKNFGYLKIMQELDFSLMQNREDIVVYLNARMDDPRLVLHLLKNVRSISNGQFAWKPNLSNIINNLDGILDFPNFSNSFTNPSLFIVGKESEYVHHDHEKIIKRLFPKSIIQRIDNAGHWVHADNPAAFIRTVETFLI